MPKALQTLKGSFGMSIEIKKLFSQRNDRAMLVIGLLPTVIFLLNSFISSDILYVFNRISFPVVIILIGIFSSKYLQTIICGSIAFALQKLVILLELMLNNSEMNLPDFYFFCSAFTLGTFAIRGMVALFMKTGKKYQITAAHKKKTTFDKTSVKASLIILIVVDIALLLSSLLFWRGVQSILSASAFLILAVAAFSAFPIELMIVILPKSLRLSIILSAVYLIPVLIIYFILLFVYTILPSHSFSDGVSRGVIWIAVFLAAEAVGGLLIKSFCQTRQSNSEIIL